MENGTKKRTPRVITRFSPNVENERADVGRDGRTRLASPNSQARTGTGIFFFFSCSPDHEEQDWQSYAVDPYSTKCADRAYIDLYMLCIHVLK